MMATAAPDIYTVNPEFEYLKRHKTAVVWQITKNAPKYDPYELLLEEHRNSTLVVKVPQEFQIKKILDFLELQDNWDEGGAIAPTKETVLISYGFAKILKAVGHSIHCSVPGPTGEIVLWLKNADKDLEFIFYSGEKPPKIVRASNSERAKRSPFTGKEIVEHLKWLKA